MKTKIFLWIFFVYHAMTSFCQTTDTTEYIPLLKPENRWNEHAVSQGTGPETYQRTLCTKLGNDTLINGVNYHKLLTTNDGSASHWEDNGYIREDIENRKVYYIPTDKPEVLLYDFNIKFGDTIKTYDFVYGAGGWFKTTITLNAVSEVMIGGKLRKHLNVHISILWDSTDTRSVWCKDHVWIEGIGNMEGFLRSTSALMFAGGERMSLLCFFENDELIYKPENTRITGCFVWGRVHVVEQIENNYGIVIFPNPVDNHLVLYSLNKQISSVEIYNISGRKVYTQLHGNTIDVSSFSKGIYLLKVYDQNGYVATYKIIKK